MVDMIKKDSLYVNILNKDLYNKINISDMNKDETYFINDDNLAIAVNKLSNLQDVTVTSPSNKQLLQYNSTIGKWVNDFKINYDEYLVDLGDVSSDITIDTTISNSFKLKITSNISIDLSSNISLTYGGSKTIRLFVFGAGDYTITWSKKFRWQNNTAPTFTSGKYALITLVTYDGHNWYAIVADGLSNDMSWYWDKVTYQTSTAGRKFARYSAISGNPDVGTVMSMSDSIERNILVLDAQYRNMKMYYTNSIENLNSSGNQLDICNNVFTVGKNASDSSFRTISYPNEDTKTSYYNTQKLVDYDSTNSQAAAYCRTIRVKGVGCDLPNINVLCRIFTESAMLDSLDPTVSSYSQYSLESWGFGSWYGCWSSSWCGDKGGVSGNYYGDRLGYTGKVEYYVQGYVSGVCPILELC